MTKADATKFTGEWTPTDPSHFMTNLNRTDYQKEKISLSLGAFRTRWNALAASMGNAPDVQIREVGESVFVVAGP